MSTATTIMRFRFTVQGPVRGVGRPRFARIGNGVRTYADRETESYAEQIKMEWIAAGRPVLPDGPYRVELAAMMQRPSGHILRDGQTLSAAGIRAQWPTRKPDVDNMLKWVDALVSVGAVPDDAKMVEARVAKGWGPREELQIIATSFAGRSSDGRDS